MNTKKSYSNPITQVQAYCATYILSGSNIGNPYSVGGGTLSGGDTGGDAGGGL